jgi:glycosyltransferase involved in cell wall biosynthesis
VEPLVSVVIPTYNNARYLGAAIDSVLAQTWPRVEVIVVDDGSRDETPQVVAPYGDRIVCLRQENQGLAGARSAGLARATGAYVAWLDSDDMWNPEKLAVQIAFLEARPDVAVVSTDFSAFDDAGYFEASHASTYYSVLRRTIGGLAGVFPELASLPRAAVTHAGGVALPETIRVFVGDLAKQLVLGNCLHPPTVVFRREAGLRAGALEKRFGHHTDWEYFMRLARQGRCAFVDLPLIRYRYSPGSMSSDKHLTAISTSHVLVLESERARDPELARWPEFRERLGHAHLASAHALADRDRPTALRHLWASLRLGHVRGETARTLAKLCLPRGAVALYRRVAHGHREAA